MGILNDILMKNEGFVYIHLKCKVSDFSRFGNVCINLSPKNMSVSPLEYIDQQPVVFAN